MEDLIALFLVGDFAMTAYTVFKVVIILSVFAGIIFLGYKMVKTFTGRIILLFMGFIFSLSIGIPPLWIAFGLTVVQLQFLNPPKAKEEE